MKIQKADLHDAPVLARLACELWPGDPLKERKQEMAELTKDREAACFLAWEENEAVGFAQCQLRHDYVESTDTSPVGYLEGIYVKENFRHKGVARALLNACEKWAREMGCTEFASDCELDNTQSLAFHLNVGFAEANRVICFTKKL